MKIVRDFFTLLSFCFTLFITINSNYNSTGPTWLPSPYFRAGNNKVITTKTGAGQQTFYTFTFSSALSGIPNLAYGVKNYRGMDTMMTESFEILRRNLTASLFRVSIEIFGITNIYLLTVPYLAIDPQFPHHLNSFDNIPINYTQGPLYNFSTKVNAITTYTNTLNYSEQSSANKYNTFTNPLSSNKIVLFLTSFEINATSSSPIDFTVVVNILNQSHYRWTVRIDRNAYVGKVHFSQIVYNEDDVTGSKTYAIVYLDWTAYVSGKYSYSPFPPELKDNMITALVDFNATAGNCGIEYNWQFVENFMGHSNVIYQNQSLPSNPSVQCGFSRTRSTIFYIKTWKCGDPFIYFNITSDNCQDGCPDYFYPNSTSAICETCFYKCISCTAPNDAAACSSCETGFNRTLANGTCKCNIGYFDDWYKLPCRACSSVDFNCLTCQYPYNPSKTTSDYQTIFSSPSWSTTIMSDYLCTQCKTNHFINSSNLCQSCQLNHCLTCINLTACQTCNSSLNTTKYTDELCYLCNVANCIMCSSDNVCVTCETDYFVSSGACKTCSSSCACGGWVLPMIYGVCSTLCGDGYKVGYEQCDDGNLNDHDGCSSTCTIEPCNLNCSCDGWIHPWANGACTPICGDTLLRGMEECDDGNTNNHDGCSSACKLEPCNVSCLCDGWVHPWVNQSCSTVCGDNFTRGFEQCDNGNLQNDDLCDQNCTWIFIQKYNDPVLLTSSMSMYPALVIFLFGFRIVGLEALNVIQSFQLLLYTQNIETFDMSFNVHGYSDSTYFPLEVPNESYVFNRFNFMYLLMMGLFLIGAAMELYQKAKANNNKITNVLSDPIGNLYDQKTVKQKSQLASEDTNSNYDYGEDFTVHYKTNHLQKTKKIINIIEPNGQKILMTQNSFKSNKSISILSGSVMFRQVFFDLVINCQYIFVYGLVIQIMEGSFKSILNFSTMIVIGSTLFVLVLMFLTIFVENPTFGENQLKFHEDKAPIYWILVIFERTIFSILLALSTKYWICTFVILGIKLVIVFIHLCLNFYYQKIQKARSVITHILHFVLILLFLLNEIVFQPLNVFSDFYAKFISCLYAGIIGLVIMICLSFYVRQFTKKCQADFRDTQNSDQQNSVRENGKAVFDVQKDYSIEDNVEQLNSQKFKSKHNIFDDLKTINYIPRSNLPSESQSPIKYNLKSKKIITSNYINYLNITNSPQKSEVSVKNKKSYQKHRRSNLKLKQNNIFEGESDYSDDRMIKSSYKSKKSNFVGKYQQVQEQVYKFDQKRVSIDNTIYLNQIDNIENQPQKTRGVLKQIRRIGMKSRKNKKQNDGMEYQNHRKNGDKNQNSANELIKVEDFGGKYSTVTNVFQDSSKTHKKRTYVHKRSRHGKKQNNSMNQSPDVSNEKMQNFDNYDAVSINFDQN